MSAAEDLAVHLVLDTGVPYRAALVAAESVLAAGYRKPRTITTAEELDALQNGVILRAGKLTYEHHEGMFNGVDGSHVDAEYISLPATVLYEPEATK